VYVAPMSLAGIRNPQQNRKNSMRAYVFRFAPEKRTSRNAVGMSVSCANNGLMQRNIFDELTYLRLAARIDFLNCRLGLRTTFNCKPSASKQRITVDKLGDWRPPKAR
jgi:hypothetical protein